MGKDDDKFKPFKWKRRLDYKAGQKFKGLHLGVKTRSRPESEKIRELKKELNDAGMERQRLLKLEKSLKRRNRRELSTLKSMIFVKKRLKFLGKRIEELDEDLSEELKKSLL